MVHVFYNENNEQTFPAAQESHTVHVIQRWMKYTERCKYTNITQGYEVVIICLDTKESHRQTETQPLDGSSHL